MVHAHPEFRPTVLKTKDLIAGGFAARRACLFLETSVVVQL